MANWRQDTTSWLNNNGVNESSIKNFFETAQNAGRTFVSVAATGGYAGFVFDITKDETVELDSEITDHYLEDGTAVQDHIALAPERVTVSGLVGEYKHISENKPNSLQKVVQKLTTLQSYLPPIGNAAQTAYDVLSNGWDGLSDAVEDVGSLWEDYRNVNIPSNEQQKAFIYFEALRNAKVTFTIQTPFRYYTDMAIERIISRQSGSTRDETEFEVVFKKIRYVSTEVTSLAEEGKRQARNAQQYSEMENKGITKGKTIESGIQSIWRN